MRHLPVLFECPIKQSGSEVDKYAAQHNIGLGGAVVVHGVPTGERVTVISRGVSA